MAARLSCKEYVAFVSVDVVENMDAIAWARVQRPIRGAELAATLKAADETERSLYSEADTPIDLKSLGAIRKIPDSVKLGDLGELASFFADGVRANPFTKGLASFIDAQTVIDDNVEMRGWAPADKHHCERRRELVRLLHEQLADLRLSSGHRDFITQCIRDQQSAFSHPIDDVEPLLGPAHVLTTMRGNLSTFA